FSGLAALCTANRQSYESLADTLHRFGLRTEWQDAPASSASNAADLFVLDGWDQLPALPRDFPNHSLLLLHFPRPDDVARAATLGIDAVVAQPLLLADLAAALEGTLIHTARRRVS